MSLTLRLIGALLATFILSRLTLFGARSVATGAVRVVLAHAISFGLLAVFVGLLKAYWVPFLWDAGLIYLVPQLVWMGYDLIRLPARR